MSWAPSTNLSKKFGRSLDYTSSISRIWQYLAESALVKTPIPLLANEFQILAKAAERIQEALIPIMKAQTKIERVTKVAQSQYDAILKLSALEREGSAITNVFLAATAYDVVFERTRVVSGLNYVGPSQIAVDLLSGPGRNP